MDNKEIRRLSMLVLAEELGGIPALAEKINSAASHLTNIKNRVKTNGTVRGIGDRLARRMEEKCGKPHGWMDRGHLSLAALGGDKNLQQLVEFYTGVTDVRQAMILTHAQNLYNEEHPGVSQSDPFHRAPTPDQFINHKTDEKEERRS